MKRLDFVQCLAIALDPRMSLKLWDVLFHADAKLGSYPLPAQQVHQYE